MFKKRAEIFYKYCYLTLGIITFLWTISFIVYHFYLYSFFGFYPSYDNPTYSEFAHNLSIIKLNGFIIGFWIVALWCAIYIFPIVFFTNLILKFTSKIRMNWKIILLSFLCCLFSWLILFILGDTFEWLLD
jgi:hypothetical protein